MPSINTHIMTICPSNVDVVVDHLAKVVPPCYFHYKVFNP